MTSPLLIPDLLGLADRVEKLSGPDRETDALLYIAANPKIRLGGRPLMLKRVWPTTNGGQNVFWYETKNGCMGGVADVPYTASIDAAMTLIPEGWSISFGEKRGLPPELRMFAWLNDHNTPDGKAVRHVEASSRTIAQAITAAALRARAS